MTGIKEHIRDIYSKVRGALSYLSSKKYTTLAGTMAFFLVMSVVPFLFWLTLLFGRLNIDFTNLQIDVPALLHYLQDLLPGEAVLRPIFATVGDVVQFLANGLSLRLSTPSAEETKITLFLNEEGRTTLSRSLSNALGTTILEGLSIGEMSLSVSLFDDETLTTINKFFENNLNISETARQLYVHRNTLVYRLERIEKAIGLDIRTFDDAMIFKIATMVLAHIKDSRQGR